MILADDGYKNITNGRIKWTAVTELTVDMWSKSVGTELWELLVVNFVKQAVFISPQMTISALCL
jgi:hypothetical protein